MVVNSLCKNIYFIFFSKFPVFFPVWKNGLSNSLFSLWRGNPGLICYKDICWRKKSSTSTCLTGLNVSTTQPVRFTYLSILLVKSTLNRISFFLITLILVHTDNFLDHLCIHTSTGPGNLLPKDSLVRNASDTQSDRSNR